MTHYGFTNLSPQEKEKQKPRRVQSVIELKIDQEEIYRNLHANVWTSVLERLSASSIRNFSISIVPLLGKKYLMSYFEYWGDDFKSDMQKIANDPETQRWWKETDPCQNPISENTSGERWMVVEEIFFHP